MHRWLGRYEPQAYAVLRIVAGFLFMFHGAQKLFGAFGGDPVRPLVSQMGLGGAIEFFGGILICIGLFASWAGFLASGMMAVAYFQAHFGNPPHGAELVPGASYFWPIQNGGEMAVLYCFVFLYVAFRGAGPWSVAAALRKPELG
jgi:putative oxidoreductase